MLAHKVRHLGDLHRHLGRLDSAENSNVEALALYRGLDDPRKLDFANALIRHASLEEVNQHPREALELWRAAGDLYDAIELAAGVDECTIQIDRLSK